MEGARCGDERLAASGRWHWLANGLVILVNPSPCCACVLCSPAHRRLLDVARGGPHEAAARQQSLPLHGARQWASGPTGSQQLEGAHVRLLRSRRRGRVGLASSVAGPLWRRDGLLITSCVFRHLGCLHHWVRVGRASQHVVGAGGTQGILAPIRQMKMRAGRKSHVPPGRLGGIGRLT